jgi:formamidopyrimidine-DNA glycosylase
MPELPEVETIRRVLEPSVTDYTITDIFLRQTRMIRGQSLQFFKQELAGRQILKVDRRGKYLIFRLNHKIFLVHLGMSGQIIRVSDNNFSRNNFCRLPDKHTHLSLWLSSGTVLYFRDPRMFGRYILSDPKDEARLFSNLGPEPLGPQFTPSGLYQDLRKSTASIKALLLNQKIVAGLGNIYVDESLFRAGINPATSGAWISKKQAEILYESIKSVITEAVNAGGTSISDFQDPEQRTGSFQHHLQVYGKKGNVCPRCGSIIIKEKLAQRGTHWCPQCQK